MSNALTGYVAAERARRKARAAQDAAVFLVREGIATVGEAARISGCSRQSLYQWTRDNDPMQKREALLQEAYEYAKATFFKDPAKRKHKRRGRPPITIAGVQKEQAA